MTTQYIEYKRKKYQVKEPTIQDWSEIMRLKDLLDENELHYRLLEKITGMPKDIILSASAKEIKLVGNDLYAYLNLESKQLFHDFDFNGKQYKLVNVSKITFGQFVDIDTFLMRDEAYRINNLHELAAYLYNEVVDGKVIEYGKIDFVRQAEEFKQLPIKYIEGAIFFFINFRKGITRTYPDLFPEKAVMDDDGGATTFGEHWGWYITISQLAQDKVWKIDKVVSQPLTSCLNHIAFIMDKNREEIKLLKEQQKNA